MPRRTAIIATITLNLLVFPAISGAGQGFSSYRVRIEVTNDGRPVCSQDLEVPAGESQEVPSSGAGEPLRVLQRVTRFPGAGDSRALIEVQVFGTRGDQQRPIVAPTLGVELGTPEVYEVRTNQGLVRISTVVEGGTQDFRDDPDGITFDTHPVDPAGL
jgi:hypothetical protein